MMGINAHLAGVASPPYLPFNLGGGLTIPVLPECKTDKSEHHQDNSGTHQPVRILHR